MAHLFAPARRAEVLPSNFFGTMDRRIAVTREAGAPVIDLSKGNPDLPTPPAIVAAMQKAVADPANHRYPAYAPRRALAEAIARRYRLDHAVDLDPETQVAVFHGSHEALVAALMALVDEGESIVVPDPGYPAYAATALLAQASTIPLPLVGDRHQPDPRALAAIDRAAALVLNYPNNPTGAMATRATFERAVAAVRRWDAVFVHDFAYSSLGFDPDPAVSALTVDTERTVEVSTLSKTYNMAGWRLGYAAGNASAIAAMRRYQAHVFSTVFGATQDAAAAALDGDQGAAGEVVEVYRRRRDAVVAGLREAGWDPEVPAGTFFVWLRSPVADDVAYAERLLAEHFVAVAPGSGFGRGGRGMLRLALVQPDEVLEEAVRRLALARRETMEGQKGPNSWPM